MYISNLRFKKKDFAEIFQTLELVELQIFGLF